MEGAEPGGRVRRLCTQDGGMAVSAGEEELGENQEELWGCVMSAPRGD